jgi:apolipoprotein N-acyltransferase
MSMHPDSETPTTGVRRLSQALRGHQSGDPHAPVVGWQPGSVIGWLLVALGAVALALGYWGVSGEALVARQLPYVASGGLVGVALVFVGALVLGLQDLRSVDRRVARVERIALELHEQLLVAEERLAAQETGDSADRSPSQRPVTTEASHASPGDATRVRLEGGDSIHRPECPIVAGKPTVPVTNAPAGSNGFTACKLCAPDMTMTARA